LFGHLDDELLLDELDDELLLLLEDEDEDEDELLDEDEDEDELLLDEDEDEDELDEEELEHSCFRVRNHYLLPVYPVAAAGTNEITIFYQCIL
jgi:hypothetical protein